MLAYIARRLLISIPVIIVASITLFWFVSVSTDPTARLRSSPDPHAVERERARLGLDDPLPVQYKNWASKFVQGDWGDSFVTRRSVSQSIRTALWNTMQLIVWAILFCTIFSVLIGVISAVKQYSALDYTFTIGAFI